MGAGFAPIEITFFSPLLLEFSEFRCFKDLSLAVSRSLHTTTQVLHVSQHFTVCLIITITYLRLNGSVRYMYNKVNHCDEVAHHNQPEYLPFRG
jgi:hypothetical protein